MKHSKKATSIIESLVVMLIIVSWVTWMYTIYWRSVDLARTTSNRIQAIQIAREWLEAMMNIRNTNWLLFSSNYKICWNSYNYDDTCVPNLDRSSWTYIQPWSYAIYLDANKWKLSDNYSWTFEFIDAGYSEFFRVCMESWWLFYQQNCWAVNNLKPYYTREIVVSYPTDSNGNELIDSENMEVTSKVQWNDWQKITKLELNTMLSNWKNKKEF